VDIDAPNNIETEQILWKGSLLPDEITRQPEDWPIIVIGQPRWWPSAQIGSNWILPQGNHRYGLVEFVFSLNPNNKKLSEARFEVILAPDNFGRQPIFYDLFPRDKQFSKINEVSVAVGPNLKFSSLDASLGKAETKLHFRKIESFTQVSGVGTKKARWIFQPHDRFLLQGCQAVYAIVQIPLASSHIRVIVDVSTSRITRFGPLDLKPSESFREHQSYTLE